MIAHAGMYKTVVESAAGTVIFGRKPDVYKTTASDGAAGRVGTRISKSLCSISRDVYTVEVLWKIQSLLCIQLGDGAA